MIHDLDATLKQILTTRMPSPVEVKFDQPVKDWNKSSSKPTLNLFLFDVRENNVLRQHQWQMLPNGNGLNGNGRYQKQRTPFRFDCHYLITAWANKIENQHQILSEAIAVLLQYPVLPDDFLVGRLQNQPFEIQARVGSHDKLTNPAELWSAMDNQIRTGVSYIVTIAINPWQVEDTEPPVRTRRLLLQQRGWPETAVEGVEIAGEITSSSGLDGLVVTLANEQWRYESVVAENGRYAINHVTPDRYTLAAWQQTGSQSQRKLGERVVTVPPPVRILALADTFHLQIGPDVRVENLHLTPRRTGFIGGANLNGFVVEVTGSAMPRTGLYQFGRRGSEEGRITAVIPASVPHQTSFRLVYQKTDDDIGNYDLSV
jgi:hypothetical protein